MTRKPDYGIDAPNVVKRLLTFGVAGILISVTITVLSPETHEPFFSIGVSLLLTAGVMLWGSKVGKLNLRDKIVGSIPWTGSEQVLDAGCGHGLMLLAAAKRLTSGKATGVDIWQQEDQADNNTDATLNNAQAEGVVEKVELKTADLRDLPFSENTFDVVLSSWVIHNIYDAPGRQKALQEIVRVMKPGGHLAITDIRHAVEYASVLATLGMADVKRSSPNFLFFIPSHTVTARKP